MSWTDPYLTTVANQIRTKRIRKPLMHELEDHLLLQKDAYLESGLSDAEAERRAIADMGDPLLIGGELDRAHRPALQWKGILLGLFFLALGVVFQLYFGYSGILNGKNFAFVCTAAGLLLLISATDYALWLKFVAPALAVWLLFWVQRCGQMTMMYSPVSLHLFDPGSTIRILLAHIAPECICVAAPMLLSMMICALRGRGWVAFALCAALPLSTALLSVLYRQTGYNSNAMMLMALISFAVMFFAVERSFFRIRKRAGRLLLIASAAWPAATFLIQFFERLSFHQPMTDEICQVLRASRLLGRGAEVDLSGWILEYPGASDALLSMIVHRFGWIFFIAFTAAAIALIAWLFHRFRHMENRMGSLIGLAGTLTLAVQIAVHYLYSFTNYTDFLCLPLVSYGNAMLIVDGVIVGMLLSVLRGQSLPEPALPPRRLTA